MGNPNALDICRTDLFTKEAELREKYPDVFADKIIRVREMYNWFLSNPDGSDREAVNEMAGRHSVSKVTLYSDLAIVKQLLPCIGAASRDFHRWRFNEMILSTFRMSEKRKDTRTMERCASSYAKNNRVDLEDEQRIPYEDIVPQPFTATDDPSVLGIKPIPDIENKIKKMIDKYRAETIDIDDVEFEEVDLQFDELFPPEQNNDPQYGEEGLL